MSEIPAYQTMMPNVIEALQFFKDETPNSKIDEFIAKKLGVESGQKKFKDQIKWSRTYLRKYAIIINTKRGYWKLEDKYMYLNKEEIKELLKEASSNYYDLRFDERP